jgi:hypothetical protein
MGKRRPHLRSLIRPGTVGILLWLVGTPAIAHAHGGMAAPDELGPPLFTSVALGFVCYWVVILWPSSKRKDDAPAAAGPPSGKGRGGRRRGASNPGENPQRLSRLKKVAGPDGA